MMDLNPRKFYLDDIIDDFISTKREQGLKCDIYEKDGIYHIEMEVPGFDKKDISMEVNDGYLVINASKENVVNEEEKNYIRRERVYGKYERSFYLGDLDEERIDAEFNNGVLNITIPRKEKIENKKTIEIR